MMEGTMKKSIGLLIVLAMCFGTMAFAAGGSEGRAPGIDIGYSIPDTTNPFLGWLTTEVKKLADADGIRLQIADAGNSGAKQIEQIENFIAMKVKVIDIMPIDPNNVQAVIQKAQSQGIKVLVAGTDTTYYDVMMNMNQFHCGEMIAEMAIDWIVKTYSKDGTEAGLPSDKKKVIVLKCTETVDMTQRSEGMLAKMKAWGKADVVVATAEARTTAAATAVMENMWQQNSDAVAVLCYNADGGLGVNEYIMGQVGVDKSRFGVFAGDWSPPIQEIIDNSASNKSVFRGTIQIVGPKINNQQMPLEQATYMLLKDLYEGKLSYGKVIEDSITKAYPAK
jgi:ABC-type sugar transport system substrate-binding protein